MSEVWKGADHRRSEFDSTALLYDQHRPPYPQAVFDDLVRVCGLEPGDRVLEIGAGTGIATLPLIECGFEVTAIEPGAAVAALLEALRPGGVVALVWTEVASWGEEPFESRLADVSGFPWAGQVAEIVNSKDSIEDDERFMKVAHRRYRFDRRLDAHTFVEVTRTYGGHLAERLLAEVEALINDEFGGTVTKVEDAAVHAYRLL